MANPARLLQGLEVMPVEIDPGMAPGMKASTPW